MAPTILTLIAAALAVVGVYLPSPYDKDGIGLRLHNLSRPGPHLLGEDFFSHARFDLSLLNRSKATFEYDPFVVAKGTHELSVSVIDPDGKPLVPVINREGGFPRDPFFVQLKLRPGESSTHNFRVREFGWWSASTPGRYHIEATWKIDGRKLMAPPVELEVVAVPPGAVLVSHSVSLKKAGVQESNRPVIQQVPFGDRTLLIYRSHYNPAQPGGGGYFTARLAELPDKVAMIVEGAYGDDGPLSITYRVSPEAPQTRLVIHSRYGSPWTQADQDSYDFKHHIAPAPRPKP